MESRNININGGKQIRLDVASLGSCIIVHNESVRTHMSFRLAFPTTPFPLRLHRLFSTTVTRNMKIIPVPVRSDNYAYLLVDEAAKQAAAIDPYDVPKVRAAALKAGVEIVAGITTHHHHDHSGGNQVCLIFC